MSKLRNKPSLVRAKALPHLRMDVQQPGIFALSATHAGAAGGVPTRRHRGLARDHGWRLKRTRRYHRLCSQCGATAITAVARRDHREMTMMEPELRRAQRRSGESSP
jgi:hypothetical protein